MAMPTMAPVPSLLPPPEAGAAVVVGLEVGEEVPEEPVAYPFPSDAIEEDASTGKGSPGLRT